MPEQSVIKQVFDMFYKGVEKPENPGLGLFRAFRAGQKAGIDLSLEALPPASALFILDFTREASPGPAVGGVEA